MTEAGNGRDKGKRKTRLFVTVFLIFFYGVGLVGFLHPSFISLILPLTPYFLFITGFYVLWPCFEEKNKPFFIWLMIVAAGTLFLEIVGVKTGLVFGEYRYGSVLGISVFGVPLVIGWNWVLLIFGAWEGLRIVLGKMNRILHASLTGILCVVFDIIMEPVAIAYGFWEWDKISVPIQNYIAWGLIAFVAALFLPQKESEPKRSQPFVFFLIQTAYFSGLNLVLRISGGAGL